MATVTELKAVLKDTLEKRGVLRHLKARIRAEVFNALDDDREPRPLLSHENLLINELIREYLEFNKYKYTASVLIAESGQPVVPLDRQFLIRELNAFEESKDNSIYLYRFQASGGSTEAMESALDFLSSSYMCLCVGLLGCLQAVPPPESDPRKQSSVIWNFSPFLAWSSRRSPECASDRINTAPCKQACQLEAQQKTR
uniref:Centrosomal protein 20 n=2 Tax=Rattus norvegicus TaxID=10116 RepID=B0BN31_RAT